MAKHREAGEAVRSIRDWGWMTPNTRDNGQLSISYGDAGTKGHYVENPDGSTAYSRDTNGTVPIRLNNRLRHFSVKYSYLTPM